MFFCYPKFIRRISLLMIGLQVALSCWNGQEVSAQVDNIQPSVTPATSNLNYSQTHALVLTGEHKDDAGNFATDKNGQLIKYFNTMPEDSVYPDSIDYQFFKAVLDTNSSSFYRKYISDPDYMNLSSGRYGHTATVLQDGRVLIVGGSNGHRVLNTSVIYDPVANRTINGPLMVTRSDGTTGRVWHSATLLPDGNVLILGGTTATASDRQAFDGEVATGSGEIYVIKENKFISLDDWYQRKNISNVSGTMLQPRTHQTAAYLPGTTKVLIVGSSDSAISSSTTQWLNPTTGSITKGCDNRHNGFSAPLRKDVSQPNPSVIRVSCSLSNPDIGPGETATLTVELNVEGNPSDWGLNLPTALLTLSTTGDTAILKPKKFFGIIPVGNSVKKTSWSLSPLSSDSSKRRYSVELSRTKYDVSSSEVQVAEVFLNISVGNQKRTYGEVFAGKKIDHSQPSVSVSPATPLSVDNFYIYDYGASPTHDMPVGDKTYYYLKTIKQLGHTASYPTYKEVPLLKKYGEQQTSPLVLYATKKSAITNSLSEFNKVAQALGAKIDPNIIITDELGGTSPTPAGVLIINNELKYQTTKIGVSDDNNIWDDTTGLFAEIFDIATGQSTVLPQSLAPNEQSSIYTLPDGRAIITGGGLSKVYVYDPQQNQVTVIGSLQFPRTGMQIIPQLDGSGKPISLFFVGGTSFDANTTRQLNELLAKGQLPADVLDLVQMKMVEQPVNLPMIVGDFAAQTAAIRPDIQKTIPNLPSITLNSSTSEILNPIQQYAKKHRLNPAVVESAFSPAGYEFVASTYFAPLMTNKYLLVSPTGALIWDINNNQAEPLLLPTRIPTHQFNYYNALGKTLQTPEDLGVKVISDQSTSGWAFDGGQITALKDGTVLISGGTSGLATFDKRIGTGGTIANTLTHLSLAWGGGMLIGIGMVGMGSLLGAMSLAFGLVVLAYDMMIAMENVMRSLTNNNKPGYITQTYAKTATSVWRFMPDPYPNLTSTDTSKISRGAVINPDLLAPPKEELLSSKPAPDQQIAGKNSNYKLEITFDKTQLSPYAGSTITGTVKAVNASGQVVPIQGAVNLYVGAGTSKLNLASSSTVPSSLGISESHKILVGPPDKWATKSTPGGQGSFPTIDYGYVISGATTLAQLSAGKPTPIINNDNGQQTLTDPNFGNGVMKPIVVNKPIIVLQNGIGTFTYQVAAHKYDNVTFAVTGQEQPVFPARNPKYVGTQTYIDNDPSKPLNHRIDLEPMDVRNQRLTTPVGYQILPDLTVQLPNKVIPNQWGKSEPAGATSPIVSVKTIKFSNYNNAVPPLITQEVVSNAGYYYDITANAPLKPKQGDKFTITITPKPNTGKALPTDIYDGINLDIMPGYIVYNKNYNQNGSQNGSFITTFPASAIDSNRSTINHSIKGGVTINVGRINGIYTAVGFNIGREPVTLELEYTGEPTQINALSLNLAVTDNRCVPPANRFRGSGQYNPECSKAFASPQTIREVIALPF